MYSTGRALVITAGLLVVMASARAEPTRLLMQPAIHGDLVAFSYGGDLWTAPVEGGLARRLTSSEGIDTSPRFSPDGKTIAFTGQYSGREDVYTVPTAGGDPTRLTFHPSSDVVRNWTVDGTKILFSSGRHNAPSGVPRLWTLSTDGGMPEMLPIYEASDGAYSPDGSRLAYVPVAPAFKPWPGSSNYNGWRHYRGGRTTSIEILKLDDLSQVEVPRENSNDFYPMWVGDTLYFLSDRDGTMNLYSYDGESVRQHTWHRDFDIESAGTDGKTIVYEQAGYLYHFNPASGEMRRIDIEVQGDFPWARPHFEKVADQVRDAKLSPTGVRAVIEARGEVFTAPAEKGDIRNLSDSPGANDRSPAWSPDGEHVAWFSDASGEYALMIAGQKGLEKPRVITFDDPSFYYEPKWSPDSKKIVFTDKHLNVWHVDVESGAVTKVDTDLFSNPRRSLDPVWSPDSKWIAYARRLDSQLRAIFVYSLDEGKTYQVTDGMSDAISPSFDASGKYLYFLASTDFALNIGWLDMMSYDREVTRGLYLAVLSKDEPSPLLPESDEEKPKEEAKASGEAEETASEKSADNETEKGEAAEKEKEGEKPKAPPVVKIDMEGIQQRILAIDVPAKNYIGVAGATEKVIFYAEQRDEKLAVHKYDLTKRKDSVFLNGVLGFDVSADGKKLLYIAGEETMGIVDTEKEKAKVGDGKLNLSAMQAKVVPEEEWAQIFRETWRIMRDFFYDPHMQGADWPAMYDKYHPLLKYVRHRSSLSYLDALMLAEVVSSHTRTGGGDMPKPKYVPVGLLGADFEFENDRFRITRIFTPESWNPGVRAPLSAPGLDVREGDYLLGVNGDEITGGNIYRYFEGLADQQVFLRVADNPAGENAREITVVPVGDETSLRVRAWIEDNRRKVDTLSDGKLAYVYLPNTSVQGYRNFNRYYFAQQEKHGAIIDERFNGGGSVADYIVDLLNRQLLSYWATRDGKPFTSPNAAIFGPKVMIINEWAGSGGDFLPYAFRKRGIGPLVGKRTWGGLIGVYDYPVLMDGGYTTAPRVAIYSTDPDNPRWIVENVGVPPDIEVGVTPADVAAGRDPQLERAVQECLRLLEEHPFRPVPRPAPIDRAHP